MDTLRICIHRVVFVFMAKDSYLFYKTHSLTVYMLQISGYILGISDLTHVMPFVLSCVYCCLPNSFLAITWLTKEVNGIFVTLYALGLQRRSSNHCPMTGAYNFENCPRINSCNLDSILDQVMTWCHHATSYYLSKCSPGGRLNKKDGLTRYGDSHVKDKTS